MKGSVFLKKILLLIAVLMTLMISLKAKTNEQIIIPDQALRFRIIANSNNLEDQGIKMQVRAVVEQKLNDLLVNANTLEETKETINSNLDNIETSVSEILDPLKIDYQVSWGENYFPAKDYKGVIYQAGEYDSLVITIGNGAGENWWCVLFPPLCFLENQDTTDVEYQLYVSRIINYFK